jgi:hypothetical protein
MNIIADVGQNLTMVVISSGGSITDIDNNPMDTYGFSRPDTTITLNTM